MQEIFYVQRQQKIRETEYNKIISIPGSMLWSQFSAIFTKKNWRFSQKPMLWLNFYKKLAVLIAKKRQYFLKNFRHKYFLKS
jgi:hypothetical protein